MSVPQTHAVLRREVGLWGAILMGMGSIVGTGVFVSIGIATGIAGPAVILAVAIAALVATCNGLSSAQLAASHAVSGGTYEYGYKYLNSWFGFSAGWMFLLAKSASAATAALGFAGYLLNALRISGSIPLVAIAFAAVLLLTVIVLSGIRRSNLTNSIIVTITLLTLIFFVIGGLPLVIASQGSNFVPFFQTDDHGGIVAALLHATALMFVAYTGYGRIATLGEEVHDPRRTIPRAILITMLLTATLYSSVAIVGIGAVGAGGLGQAATEQAAPLEVAARSFGIPGSSQILAIGAVTAMLGVLLNLLLGLSRVLLAMGRRGDMPAVLGKLNPSGTTPTAAVIAIGVTIAALTLIGNVKTTWSFSAFTVLIYYALTNLAALRIPAKERLYPRWIAWLGLLSCLFLAFWVEWQIWITGLLLLAGGLVWHAAAQSLSARKR
jgi:basic amino acid/polyamine antiporter, APA family